MAEGEENQQPGSSTVAKNPQKNRKETIYQPLGEKHALQNRWALWYLKADRNRCWEDCLKQLAVFETVEDFWSLYSNIQPCSALDWGSDYYLFKENIRPMWEDSSNVRGGRWLVVVEKRKRQQLLDHYWMELMMAMVGEQFEDSGELICGAVVNVRQKGDKVSLWTRDAEQDNVNMRIGQILKAKLTIPATDTLRYEVHKDSSRRTSSMVKPRIVIPGIPEPPPSAKKKEKTGKDKENEAAKESQ
ncbi:unnamed protein product, partial [Mesorhabditis spiculigera]